MIKFPKEIKKIISTLQNARFEAYAVGPCVRDSICGLDPYAWDISTNADFSQLRGLFPEAKVISEKYSTIRFEYLTDVVENNEVVGEEGLIVDVNTFRNPDRSFADNVKNDLERFDFICDQVADGGINVVDINKGFEHNRKKLVDTSSSADILFSEKPMKMMDAMNIVSHLGYDLSKPVYEAIIKNVRKLNDDDMATLGEKFYEMMSGSYTGKALNMALDLGIIKVILGDENMRKLSYREKQDLLVLCENIDKTHRNAERRLGLFYGLMDKRKAMPSIKKLQFGSDLEQKLIDAVTDMPKLFFAVNAVALKKFIYDHGGYDRFNYMMNLEKAQRIAFELDTELKIRSKLFTLDQINSAHEPIMVEDLCIDANDLMGKGIAKDKEEADQLLRYVVEHLQIKPKLHTREQCFELAKKFKKNPIARAVRRIEWLH